MPTRLALGPVLLLAVAFTPATTRAHQDTRFEIAGDGRIRGAPAEYGRVALHVEQGQPPRVTLRIGAPGGLGRVPLEALRRTRAATPPTHSEPERSK